MEITDKTEVTDKTEITERTEITEETNRMDVMDWTEITERTGGDISGGEGKFYPGIGQICLIVSYWCNWVNWGFKSECVVFLCLSFVCCACILAFLDLWRPC